MIVDANLLLFAEDSSSPFHEPAREWLTEALNGDVRVGLPWPSLLAFVRIRTNPRANGVPLSGEEAWDRVEGWLSAAAAWVPSPTDRHFAVLGGLIRSHRLSGNAIPDAHLAALAIEYGVTIYSADSDFARFPEVRWTNPLHP